VLHIVNESEIAQKVEACVKKYRRLAEMVGLLTLWAIISVGWIAVYFLSLTPLLIYVIGVGMGILSLIIALYTYQMLYDEVITRFVCERALKED